MFTQKLQNPFLKPTPYFSTNNYTGHSYAPPLPPANKYSGYSSYDTQKKGRYDSYTSINDRAPEISIAPRYNPSTEISDILRNNPFNRPTNSIFNTSSANSYSPAKYDSTKNSRNNLSNSYEKKDANDSHSSARRNYAVSQGMNNQYSQNQYSQGRHTPKKYDNYLSNSSADSAVTYINKIYEIDDDKSEGYAALNNPFQRKNLVEAKAYEKEAKPANSYDHATMKYIAEKKQYSAPNYMENNYFATRQQQPKPNDYTPYSKDYSHLQYKRQSQNFGSKKDLNQQNSYRAYDEAEPNRRSSKEKVTFGKGQTSFGSKNNIESKYDIKYDQKYSDNRFDSKYNKYEETGRENYGSKHKPQYRPYNQEKESYNNKYDERFKQLQKSDSKFDFEESQHKQSLRYTNTQKDDAIFKDRYPVSKLPKYQQNQDSYKYSFKGDSNEYRDISRQSKKYQDKVSFPDSETLNESSKHRNRQYSGRFQTLGGVPANKYRQDVYTKPNDISSKKLISSQVEEYEPQVESKYKSRNYQKPKEGLQTSKEKPKYAHYEQQQDEQYDFSYKSKKGPVRDSNQTFPSIIHYNGMVFSRIEVK